MSEYPKASSEAISLQEQVPSVSNKPMQEAVAKLAGASRFERTKASDGKEIIKSPETGEFRIYKLENEKDPMVDRLHRYMLDEFGEEESETIEWLRISIRDRLNNYHIVEDGQGNIAAFSNSQHLELPPQGGTDQTRESLLAMWHIATREDMRGKGMGRELYRKIYSDTLEDAKEKSRELKAIVGEAVASSEEFHNKIGWWRAYYNDQKGNVREVPYVCPPVDADSETGEPTEDPVPEHIMIQLLSGAESLENEELLRMINVMYREYVGQEHNYASRESYEKSLGYNMDILDSLRKAISRSPDGKVFFLSGEEREQKKKELRANKKRLYEVKTEEEE